MPTNNERQREYWEQEHGHRGYQHPVVRTFAQQRLDYIQKFLDLSSISNALDVGCGNGFSTYSMAEHIPDIWAVDRSHKMLKDHPLNHTHRIAKADALELPFPDNSFDLVYGWEILHHVAEPWIVLKEMARVSRRYVLCAEPNRNNPAQFAFALVDPEHRWVLRYSLKYMSEMFAKAGLDVEHRSVGGWLFPNVTPMFALPFIKALPYAWAIGISNWVLGVKQ